MLTLLKKTVSTLVLLTAFCTVGSVSLEAQAKADTAIQGSTQEFPVVLQQSVTAGKTMVGTKVEAKLSIATLLSGVVFPRNSILSGEVVESAAKTKTEPSRISIRIDSVN